MPYMVIGETIYSNMDGPRTADFVSGGFWTRFENLVTKPRKSNDRVVPNLVADT